jgi:hypothetical protein
MKRITTLAVIVGLALTGCGGTSAGQNHAAELASCKQQTQQQLQGMPGGGETVSAAAKQQLTQACMAMP